MSVYGTNQGYSLNAMPLSAVAYPSQTLVRQNAKLYTPNIISQDPSWTTNSMTMAVASSAPRTEVMCANREQAQLFGAAKCISTANMKCVRPVNNMCPKGFVPLVNGQVVPDFRPEGGYAPFR
jgi:hypothetical protein